MILLESLKCSLLRVFLFFRAPLLHLGPKAGCSNQRAADSGNSTYASETSPVYCKMTWTSSQISVALSCKLSQFVHINPQFHNYINTEMILWNVSQQPHFMPPWRKNQPKDEAAYIHFIDLNIKFCDSCFCASHMRINSKLQIVTVFPSTIVCASHNLWPPQKMFCPTSPKKFCLPSKI